MDGKINPTGDLMSQWHVSLNNNILKRKVKQRIYKINIIFNHLTRNNNNIAKSCASVKYYVRTKTSYSKKLNV